MCLPFLRGQGIASHSFLSEEQTQTYLSTSGGRATYEHKVPEEQEQVLGRKRATEPIEAPTKGAVHPSKKEKWETGNLNFVLTFGSQ